MAVAEQPAQEQTPQSQNLQLGVSSLLGAALVLTAFILLFGVVPTAWDTMLGISEALKAGRPPAINEFLSDTLLLLIMIAVGTGIFFGLRHLERNAYQPGLRAGIFCGAVALYIVLGLVTKLAPEPPAADEDLNVIALGMTFVALGVLLVGAWWVFTRAGFAHFLIRFEEQGWFHAIGYKSNQGVRVRRGTILALLVIFFCGIYTIVSHNALGSSRLEVNDWDWDLPFSPGEGMIMYIPIMHKIHITIPILLGVVSLWVAWRVVNWPNFADFLIATEAEMNKVSWTTRRRLVQDTIVVLVTVFLLTAFLFLVDILWIKILTNPYVGVLQVDVKGEFQKQQEKTQW